MTEDEVAYLLSLGAAEPELSVVSVAPEPLRQIECIAYRDRALLIATQITDLRRYLANHFKDAAP